MTDSANIKQTEQMNRYTYTTEKPIAHLAHLVLPDTLTWFKFGLHFLRVS